MGRQRFCVSNEGQVTLSYWYSLCLNLCAAEDSEGTSVTAQSAANTPLYQTLDVQGAVLPRINRNHDNWDVSQWLAAHPAAHGQEKGLLHMPTSRLPMGTPESSLPSELELRSFLGFYSTSHFSV